MVGRAGSRTEPCAYAALMLRSRSGICGLNSPNQPSVRDRGVGGSNPLAPTKTELSRGQISWEIWPLCLFDGRFVIKVVGHSVFDRVIGPSNPVLAHHQERSSALSLDRRVEQAGGNYPDATRRR